MGFRYLETDVRLSADGVVFAVHDETLERLTGSTAAVNELTAEQLEQQLLDGREPLVRMADLFEAFPDAHFNIDVKSNDVVRPTCDLIAKLGAFDRACIGSFEQSRVNEVRKLLPQLATSAATKEVAIFKLAPAAFLRGRWRPGAVCLQIPVKHGLIALTTRALISRAHRFGMQVHVWTIDDAEQMNRLLDLGVDGIVTNRTDILKQVLVARGSWKDPA
jgi:glycerophosphoryl diester phosphodiesterase